MSQDVDNLLPPPGEQAHISRRQLLKKAAALAVLPVVLKTEALEALMISPAGAQEQSDIGTDLTNLMENDPELAAQPHSPEDNSGHEEELHGPGLVDWVGAANFFAGVRDLLPGGKGHIDKTRYASLATLLAIKYNASDETDKEHLQDEFKSVAMSGTIIEGTILASEALKLDFAEAYRSITANEIDQRNAIPLLTMFAALTSPTITTVGSAGILSKQSQQLAEQLSAVRSNTIEDTVDGLSLDDDKKQEVYRILTAHVSNLSGFVLFGDPPFIAMAEKYGLPDALKYQLHACLPLAMQSLYAANHQLHKIKLGSEGLTGAELTQRARREAIAGMWRNKEVLTKMCASSFANFAKVFALQKSRQSDKGIQFDFTGMIRDKVQGSMQLMFSEHIESHETHEATGSRTYDIDPLERTEATSIALQLLGGHDGEEGKLEHSQSIQKMVNELVLLIDDQNYMRLSEIMSGYDMSQDEINQEISRLQALARFSAGLEFGRLDDKDIEHEGWLGRIAMAPKRFFGRVTHLDRIKHALGHASADVLNVFPFQALSVPFLIPIFRKGIDEATTMLESAISDEQSLAGLNAEELRELAVSNMIAVMVAIKSSIADNYVAAKIGLELMPDKPSYPLIAAITGGRLTAIGNMANPTLVPLSEYGMEESIRKIPKNLPSVLVSLTWANILELAKNVPGMPKPPTAKD